MSPIMDKLDGMHIVLNLGARPYDLDGHLLRTGRGLSQTQIGLLNAVSRAALQRAGKY
jgi:hypothetical protein